MADIFDLFKKISHESAPRASITHIVVGLGNPGKEYETTRHNAGFLCMDYIAQKYGVRVDRVKFNALCGEATINGVGVLLLKPQTYMNESGTAVQQAAAFYKVPVENIVVLCDDVNLDVARLRVRRNGSDGGQRGLRSIIKQMGSEEMPRIRIGVGQKPHPDFDMAAWVLSNFTSKELDALSQSFVAAEVGLRKVLAGDFDGAMQHCNGFVAGGKA